MFRKWLIILATLLPFALAQDLAFGPYPVFGKTAQTTYSEASNQPVQVKVRGTVILGAFAGSSTPDGNQSMAGAFTGILYTLIPSEWPGALLVEDTHELRLCGSACVVSGPEVTFRVNDSATANNVGCYFFTSSRELKLIDPPFNGLQQMRLCTP